MGDPRDADDVVVEGSPVLRASADPAAARGAMPFERRAWSPRTTRRALGARDETTEPRRGLETRREARATARDAEVAAAAIEKPSGLGASGCTFSRDVCTKEDDVLYILKKAKKRKSAFGRSGAPGRGEHSLLVL
jgi:hypothetical protein